MDEHAITSSETLLKQSLAPSTLIKGIVPLNRLFNKYYLWTSRIFLKIYSGFVSVGRFEVLSNVLSFKVHGAPLLDVSVLFLVTFHAMYGLWKILSSKVKRERALFWFLTSFGTFVFVLALIFVYIV